MDLRYFDRSIVGSAEPSLGVPALDIDGGLARAVFTGQDENSSVRVLLVAPIKAIHIMQQVDNALRCKRLSAETQSAAWANLSYHKYHGLQSPRSVSAQMRHRELRRRHHVKSKMRPLVVIVVEIATGTLLSQRLIGVLEGCSPELLAA